MVLKTDRLTAAIEFYSELLPTWWCSGAKKILLRYAIVEVGLVELGKTRSMSFPV